MMYVIEFKKVGVVHLLCHRYYNTNRVSDSLHIYDFIQFIASNIFGWDAYHYNAQLFNKAIALRFLDNQDSTVEELMKSQSIDNQLIAFYMVFSADDIEYLKKVLKNKLQYKDLYEFDNQVVM